MGPDLALADALATAGVAMGLQLAGSQVAVVTEDGRGFRLPRVPQAPIDSVVPAQI